MVDLFCCILTQQSCDPLRSEERSAHPHQAQNMCIAFAQRRPNVFDVGPTLYECYTNVWRLRGASDMFFLRIDPTPARHSVWQNNNGRVNLFQIICRISKTLSR